MRRAFAIVVLACGLTLLAAVASENMRRHHGLPLDAWQVVMIALAPAAILLTGVAYLARLRWARLAAVAASVLLSYPFVGILVLLARGVPAFSTWASALGIAMSAAALLAIVATVASVRAIDVAVGLLLAFGAAEYGWSAFGALSQTRTLDAVRLVGDVGIASLFVGSAALVAWWLLPPRASLQDERPASTES